MKQVSPSILASDMLNLGNEIKKIENSGAKYVHIDIMDGCFVPNISFGMPIISAVRKCTDLVLDVHAMIVQPQRYIEEFIKCGADIVTFHIEASNDEDIRASIDLIKSLGKKVGLSIKPKTPAEAVIPYVNDIDMVLVMTVEPGYGGQKLIPETIEKVRKLKAEIEKRGLNVEIQVDGGVNSENAPVLAEAGATILVAGSSVFGAEDRSAAINALRSNA